MALAFRCVNKQCGKVLWVADTLAGKPAKCPSCGQVQIVPARGIERGTALAFRCANERCGKTLSVADAFAGKPAKCPNCGQVQIVPTRSQVAAEPPAPRRPQAELAGEVRAALPAGGDADTARKAPNRPNGPPPEAARSTGRRSSGTEGLMCPSCEEPIEPGDAECPACGQGLDPRDLHAEAAYLAKQRDLCQALSLVFGLPGTGLGVAGVIVLRSSPLLGPLLGLVGALLLWVGIGFGVVYKRDNLAWILLGLLYLFGVIILAVLPDQKGRRLARIRTALRDPRQRP